MFTEQVSGLKEDRPHALPEYLYKLRVYGLLLNMMILIVKTAFCLYMTKLTQTRQLSDKTVK